MHINAIIFDMDDTLYMERDYVISGYKAVDHWVTETYKKTGFYDIATQLFNSGEKKFTFNRALEELNISYDEQTIGQMLEKYRFHEPEIHLLEEAEWVLKHLIGTVKIGLISDGYLIAQEQKVKALNIKEKFDSIILTDSLGREHWKPSPVPYEKASKVLNVPHPQCVYVGDNTNKDFITAKKLGWATVHIDRNEGIYSNQGIGEDYRAHYTIKDLKELSYIPVLKHIFIESYETRVNRRNS